MILFLREDEVINKYSVDFNHEEVNKLRTEIIDKCSTIVHHEEDLTWCPMVNDSLRIRNLKKSEDPVGTQNFGTASKQVYHYTYDEYVYPKLVYIIDELLNDDLNGLIRLCKYKTQESDNYDDFIEMALKRFEEADLDNIEEKKQILNKINDCLEQKKLLQNRKPELIDEYYVKILSLISFRLFGSIEADKVESIMNFFDGSISNIDVMIDTKLRIRKLLQK